MADQTEVAFEIADGMVARGLATINADLPGGVAGECEQCFEVMPRLIGGRCGFCRDGRRPPLSFYDADRAPPAPVVALPKAAMEEPVITPNTADKKVISVPTSGRVLETILAHAEATGLPMGQAVVALLEASTPSDVLPTASVITLANVLDVDLAQEVVRRLTTGPGSDDFDAAIGRAEAAEARAELAENKLATLKGLLS